MKDHMKTQGAELLREAAQNLRDLMDEEKAREIELRYFLPDELEGFALMLEDSLSSANDQEQERL